MEDLKLKFKLFIQKQGSRKDLSSPVDEDGQCSDVLPAERDQKSAAAVYKPQESHIPPPEEQPTDQDILKSIEDIYFSSSNFDASKYELLRLPEQINCDDLKKDLQRLRRQLDVVSSQVLQLILGQQPSCQEEFTRVEQVQQQLQAALVECRAGRSQLGLARKHFTTASLGLLANYRKRQRAMSLLHSLSTIKTLQRTEERLQELLREEDFAGAISLLLECQTAASSFRHFACVAALNGQLQDTLLMAEESLDQALAKSCVQFDASQYSKLQEAYVLLGKTQIAADQLVMHFTSAVHNAAFSTVCEHGGANVPPNSKKSYPQLCKFVSRDKLIACLLELCKALWTIVSCYRDIVKWHAAHPTRKQSSGSPGSAMEDNAASLYVRQKLEAGRTRVWHDVQAKVAALLMGCEPSEFKVEEFLQVLDLVDTLVRVGDEFCDSGSKELQAATRSQSLNYLRGYHLARMDELCMFLENEGWARCPVRATFCALQLQEFRWAGLSPIVRRNRSFSSRASTSSSDEGYFSRFPRTTYLTPFDPNTDDSPDEDFYSENGEEAPHVDSEEEEENTNVPARGHRTVLVANTTLSVLRLIGRYLRVMRLLQPIALDVLRKLSQLVDLYMYAVHAFFARDMPGIRENEYSYRLQACLKTIHDTLILSPNSTFSPDIDPASVEMVRVKVHAPQLSPLVKLDNPDDLYGLAERMVAVESLAFLAAQLGVLRPQIQALLPEEEWPSLEHFYKQLSITDDLRRPVYMCVAWNALDLRQLLAQMSKVNWEVRDVMSQHSSYVDMVLRELQIFSMRLAEVNKRVPVPRPTRELLWQLLSHLVCNTFVEGFASAKKCSNGGRGLMQLDFTQFASKLERIAELRPIPGRELVEQYVKAYYLPEPALEAWIREHTEYPSRQLIALVNTACQNNKKTRQLLLSLIEDLGR